jgi:DNA-directed RNA polymerase specialized sigma24 family protein
MASGGSITHWIKELREGDSAAAEALWHCYFPRLVEFARDKLQGAGRGMADEEDVALSVLNCFYRVAQEGRYPDLADRNGLWRLLLQITSRRAIDLMRCEKRKRRGGGQIRRGVIGCSSDSQGEGSLLSQMPDNSPTPEFAAMMADECRRLLEQLHDVELRAIALAKVEGLGNAEIAAQLNCSERTVERRLNLIREKWKFFCKQEERKSGREFLPSSK